MSSTRITDEQLLVYLQLCCLERGLSMSGTADELRHRLRYHSFQQPAVADTDTSSQSSDETDAAVCCRYAYRRHSDNHV